MARAAPPASCCEVIDRTRLAKCVPRGFGNTGSPTSSTKRRITASRLAKISAACAGDRLPAVVPTLAFVDPGSGAPVLYAFGGAACWALDVRRPCAGLRGRVRVLQDQRDPLAGSD